MAEPQHIENQQWYNRRCRHGDTLPYSTYYKGGLGLKSKASFVLFYNVISIGILVKGDKTEVIVTHKIENILTYRRVIDIGLDATQGIEQRCA